ncbi:unnamed protein product, partial [Ectocarpus sp. 8 AP-2014]
HIPRDHRSLTHATAPHTTTTRVPNTAGAGKDEESGRASGFFVAVRTEDAPQLDCGRSLSEQRTVHTHTRKQARAHTPSKHGC